LTRCSKNSAKTSKAEVVNNPAFKLGDIKEMCTYFVENEAQSLIFPIYDEDFRGWYTG